MMEREYAEKLVEAIDKLRLTPITWLKFRIGSSQYWILSKEKPEQTSVAGSAVHVEGEIVPGWWLWTY